MLRPRLKLEGLSSFRCLLALILARTVVCMYSTEVSAEGIRKRQPCDKSREVLPEAGEKYEGSEMEVLETMKVAKFVLSFKTRLQISTQKN
jgi:hypothetical protein